MMKFIEPLAVDLLESHYNFLCCIFFRSILALVWALFCKISVELFRYKSYIPFFAICLFARKISPQ